MNPSEIALALGHHKSAALTSWDRATSWQRGAFAHEMKDRQYGWDAVQQAWGWFLAGWEAGQP